jgi:hypothetical protein
MINDKEEYSLTDESGKLKIFYTKSENEYSLALKNEDEIFYQIDTKNKDLTNNILEKTEDLTFSERYYYFKDMYNSCSQLIEKLGKREDEINESTEKEYPFIFACITSHLFYILRILNEKFTINFIDEKTVSLSSGYEKKHHVELLKLFYPLFKDQYPILMNHRYLAERDDGTLEWKESKQSLAEYFNGIKPKKSKNNWKLIEQIFKQSDLAQSLYQSDQNYDLHDNKKKYSKAYQKLQKILKNTRNSK